MGKRGPKLGSKNKKLQAFKVEAGHSGLNKILLQYKANAKIRKLIFSLSYDQMSILTKQNCAYCDSPPSRKSFAQSKSASERVKLHSLYIYNGIDRIDSNDGYILSNCVACCKNCNYMKNNLTTEQFINHINKIHLFQNRLGK